ncbi:hypothetical protein MRX96_005143 [Rhipicephalus microplus]
MGAQKDQRRACESGQPRFLRMCSSSRARLDSEAPASARGAAAARLQPNCVPSTDLSGAEGDSHDWPAASLDAQPP